ncbi:MAG: hypothetical protein Q9191_007708 [Dirinaria sp. TL-2023a]
MTSSRISELSAIIATHTKHVDEQLAAAGSPTPSFDADSPPRSLLDSRIVASRQAILAATDELHALMLGPVGTFTSQPVRINSWISIHAIYRFGFASAFPPGQDEATFAEISEATGVAESHVRRLLRHAMTFRIFQEPRKGVVRHTAASKAMADNAMLRQWIGMVSEEHWPAMTKGYNIAHNTDANIFDEVAKSSAREQRFAVAMKMAAAGPGLEHSHMLDGFDWNSIGKGVVVDVGGSQGAVCIAIAKRFASLRCIVQDRPEVVAKGREDLPPALSDRVSFMGHDIFTDQPVKDADVYILRWILHDWSDKYASRVLQALVPALKTGARVLVVEHIMPDPGSISTYEEKAFRSFDFSMWAGHNGKERSLDEWTALFELADPNFEIVGVMKPTGSRLSIIEARWRAQHEH